MRQELLTHTSLYYPGMVTENHEPIRINGGLSAENQHFDDCSRAQEKKQPQFQQFYKPAFVA